MPFKLIDLPYGKEALAPVISAETLQYHHGKHHAGYIKKVNAAIEGTPMDDIALEQVISTARDNDQGLFNNAAQSWNHAFYWHSLTADPAAPAGALLDAIEASFGSVKALTDELASRGGGHFASGWVWLAEQGGALSIEEKHDGDTLADSAMNPLLVIDLWEHAYYIDHRNDRGAYLQALIAQRINWGFAAENLARGSAWTYPG